MIAAVVVVVVIAGFCTSKGELVRSILYPKEMMFKFYEDAVKFVGVLACLATVGMVYSAATLIMKHVRSNSSSCNSISSRSSSRRAVAS